MTEPKVLVPDEDAPVVDVPVPEDEPAAEPGEEPAAAEEPTPEDEPEAATALPHG
jgi:hypothetical protein